MQLLRFYAHYFRSYTGWMLLAAISIPMYGVATTAMVSLIEPIFDKVLLASHERPAALEVLGAADGSAEGAESSWLNIKQFGERGYAALERLFGVGPDDALWFVPVVFVAVFLLRAAVDFLSGYSFQHIGLGVTTDVRNDLHARLLHQTSAFHGKHPSGQLVSRVVNDVGLIQAAVTNRLLDLVQQSVTLVFLLGLLLSTNLRLALVCLVATPLIVFPVVRFGKGMRKTSHRSQERLADVTALLTESLRGHRVVKAFGKEAFEERRFRVATRQHLRVNLWAQLLNNLSSPVIESLAAIGSAALLVYAGLQVRAGTLTAPELVQFIANLLLMYDPIRKLNKVNLILQHALAGAHRVRDLMEIPIDVVERPGAVELAGAPGVIRFDGLRFGYGDEAVLRGIDLEIHAGEVVALVGPSGAGKTTLVNLLPRFHDPDEGAILFDGRDIRDLTIASLRRQIGIVTQETVLFDDTIRDNIAYGREDHALEDVREAARSAYADDFIRRQPGGYDTPIGEGGSHLSGGQRQRLAIARALLANAPILILDEATSHLDSESEALVQRALGNLLDGRTTLVVAHRLATVMRADRIVVMDAGRIVESGTHADLLERGGLYRKLYDLQFAS